MRPIKDCLNKELANLCQHSMKLAELSLKISQLLPYDLAKSCEVGSFDKGCLTLTTTDATWASQLRFVLYDLRDALRKETSFHHLISIKVVLIEPSLIYENPPAQRKYSLSAKAKSTIVQQSEYCTYPPLKKALLKLAGSKL